MYKDLVKTIDTKSITIVSVSKRQSVAKIDSAWQQGARHFGENYLQEAKAKIAQLHSKDIIWHFIGTIQSNKTREIAYLFDWVQSVDRVNIAERLSRHRSREQPPLNLCIQVNMDDESQKAGCSVEQCQELAKHLISLPNLILRGIMIIPKQQAEKQLIQTFKRSQALFRQIQKLDSRIDTLSMGMSDDYLLAIEHGATIVRLGTAIFGTRC